MWICNNPNCSKHNVDVNINSSLFVFKTAKERAEILTCKECKTKLTFVDTKAKNFNISIFKSMTNEEKKEVVNKRAKKYQDKYLKDELHDKKQQAYNSAKIG